MRRLTAILILMLSAFVVPTAAASLRSDARSRPAIQEADPEITISTEQDGSGETIDINIFGESTATTQRLYVSQSGAMTITNVLLTADLNEL